MAEQVVKHVYEIRARVRLEDEQGPYARTTPSLAVARFDMMGEAWAAWGATKALVGLNCPQVKQLLKDNFGYDPSKYHNLWIDSVVGLYEISEVQLAGDVGR